MKKATTLVMFAVLLGTCGTIAARKDHHRCAVTTYTTLH